MLHAVQSWQPLSQYIMLRPYCVFQPYIFLEVFFGLVGCRVAALRYASHVGELQRFDRLSPIDRPDGARR